MRRSPLTLTLTLTLTWAGCHHAAPSQQTPAADPADAVVKTASSGPVQATVSLAPKKPRLGDPLVLTLRVTAPAGVSVDMPPFGEALGRFAITSFTPRSGPAADGGTEQVQRYVLDAPMSGPQRVPALRVEFTTADGAGHELLTDELPVDIASVLPSGDADKETLRSLRGALPEAPVSPRRILYLISGAAAAVLAALLALRRAVRRRAARRARISAYDQAAARLGQLERRGVPRPDQLDLADAFHVELSAIVRRYIEDRIGVRAPELTTEEFLREAQRLFQPAERDLLAAFLLHCDRVKFAGHHPAEDESRKALRDAWRFLEDAEARQRAGEARAALPREGGAASAKPPLIDEGTG